MENLKSPEESSECSEKEPQNLIERLLSEIDRVTKIRSEYLTIPAGFIAASLMQIDLNDAKKSIANGDVVHMLMAYGKLKTYEW